MNNSIPSLGSFNPTPKIDNLMALRILHMLVTPFEDTEAYKLGIINDEGVPLKKAYTLNKPDEIKAYTYLHRLVFRLKRIIKKVPLENLKFSTYSAALSLIKENYSINKEPSVFEFENRMLSENIKYDTSDAELVESFFSTKYIMPFKLFSEEMGTAALSSAPANNIGTPGIAMPDPAPLGVKKVLKRKTNEPVKKTV